MLITYPRDGIRRLRRALLHSYAGFFNEAGTGRGHRLSSRSAPQPL